MIRAGLSTIGIGLAARNSEAPHSETLGTDFESHPKSVASAIEVAASEGRC